MNHLLSTGAVSSGPWLERSKSQRDGISHGQNDFYYYYFYSYQSDEFAREMRMSSCGISPSAERGRSPEDDENGSRIQCRSLSLESLPGSSFFFLPLFFIHFCTCTFACRYGPSPHSSLGPLENHLSRAPRGISCTSYISAHGSAEASRKRELPGSPGRSRDGSLAFCE